MHTMQRRNLLSHGAPCMIFVLTNHISISDWLGRVVGGAMGRWSAPQSHFPGSWKCDLLNFITSPFRRAFLVSRKVSGIFVVQCKHSYTVWKCEIPTTIIWFASMKLAQP